ncbi:TonB-dependent receptor [Neiella sp. HB171785]|uniref:TonB-dependent receptor n=1 Tax=Neiella litorisoli TaxID=2771431 RepID=A0A8J6QV62_9GAMM|nr:TonB-dependent receptor [Neiella litorisoli]MBD1390013.1 TonB-dependent receptor [Neiella litorisoli]
MNTKHTPFRLSAVCLAVASVMSASVFAAEAEETAEASAEEVEVIEVTGLRGSIKKSINDKRFAQQIVDSINAEDIGKSTDQNIAEALGRVTGVSVRTEGGEGTQISVRGTNSQQNNISLNGVTLGSTDFSQGVDLSQFSSDILSKIEVVKTPSADHDEGSLGANINLTSAKPLDLNYKVRTLTGQSRYNDLSEEHDYKISGSFSEKFFDETFAFLITAYKETNTFRRDQFEATDWQAQHSPVARDQDGNLLEDVWGITPFRSKYQYYEEDRDRMGVDLSLQWQPDEDTNIDVNLNYSKQELTSDMQAVIARGSNWGNLVAGQPTDFDPNMVPEYTDPEADWHTLNTDTMMWTKWLNRFGLGDLEAASNDLENINKVASFKVDHQLTETVNIQFGAGYSKAEQDPGNAIYTNTQNFANMNSWTLFHTLPEDLEPVGYQCNKSGKKCSLVGGEGYIDYGENNDFGDPNAVWDNRSTTGFNPQELEAQHLGYLARTLRAVEDEQKNVHFDVDWDVEFGPLTKIEVGAKWSNRDKYVDDQVSNFSSVGEGVVVTNPDTGEPVTFQVGLKDLTGDMYAADGKFPASGFMSGLGYKRDMFTRGWNHFDPEKAFEVALGSAEVEMKIDDSATRWAELDTIAAYFKTDFELLDGQLTGDVGVRYVKTDVDTKGYSGVTFHSDPGNLGRVFDPHHMAEVRNSANPACPDIIFYGTNWNEETRWSRVDGLGYDTLGTNDKRDDVKIPDAGACYDARAERDSPEGGTWWLWRHSDVSTEAYYVYGDERRYDDNGNLLPTEDRSKRSFGVEDEHDYDIWLPSLNLNYIINDEMIARFAASKTMSRPQIDSLRPGFKVVETVWGGNDRNNTITLTNTKLDPLESNNLDLSFEWYFNEAGMVTATVFYKDMSNFEESETVNTYMDDLRGVGLDPDAPAYDVNDLVKVAGVDSLEGCMPKRAQMANELYEDWWYSDNLEDTCAVFKTTRIRNGKGADIKGLELQYMQTFDELPGWMAGLGVQANYTYQDSSYDQEVSSIDDSVTLPELPVAYTPENSYNFTGFWEMNGHQVRLAYQGTDDQLVQRSWEQGTLWEDGRNTLDFSASYQFNEHILFTLQAVNLTDEPVRQYFTSRFLDLGGTVLDEGDSGPSTRTVRKYHTGTTYRAGIRVNFF